MLAEINAELAAGRMRLTTETLADFRRARAAWLTPGTIEYDDPTVLLIVHCRAVRGQPRRNVALVDVGDARILYTA